MSGADIDPHRDFPRPSAETWTQDTTTRDDLYANAQWHRQAAAQMQKERDQWRNVAMAATSSLNRSHSLIADLEQTLKDVTERAEAAEASAIDLLGELRQVHAEDEARSTRLAGWCLP